ncbi:hypothetical protein V498_06794 [Pseudogymnoascus sp. VKM F-4517 (FW-2822)]|nr:hypothetical protein V498_06794 [Pseudogymnoascus sp. VKM F-4517 (FW-2822)]
MLFSKVLPLAAFASLATANLVARFTTIRGDKFDITTNDCVNFEKTQPIYNIIQVADKFVCELFSDRNCRKKVERAYEGAYEITYVEFEKSTILRAHHSATARLTTINPQGSPIIRQIEVWLGDPGSAYVMFDPQFSEPFQVESTLQGGDRSIPQDLELLPLEFHHDTRHFAHKSSPYPRLEIPQDLVGRSGAQGKSPATLHIWGVTHAITLDGTADSGFQHCLRESYRELGPVLDELKDRSFRFLTSSKVIKLHSSTITTAQPSQPAMLDSAIASPMNIKHYQKEENIFQLAANLAEKIMKNHAYQDGNKRTALVAADMFLRINGYKPQNMAQETVNTSIADAQVLVATSQWDAEKLGRFYQSIAAPIDHWTLDIVEYRDDATEY